MSQSEAPDKTGRNIKITGLVFLLSGLLVGISGAALLLIQHRWELGKLNLLAGAILVGIGVLAFCIHKAYERMDKIEAKIDRLSESVGKE